MKFIVILLLGAIFASGLLISPIVSGTGLLPEIQEAAVNPSVSTQASARIGAVTYWVRESPGFSVHKETLGSSNIITIHPNDVVIVHARVRCDGQSGSTAMVTLHQFDGYGNRVMQGMIIPSGTWKTLKVSEPFWFTSTGTGHNYDIDIFTGNGIHANRPITINVVAP